MRTPKETILRALAQYRGDDLERARHAFANRTQQGMDEEYGQSGQTCRQILAGYEEHAAEVDAAVAWVNARG